MPGEIPTIKGGCMCGAIRYEISAPPSDAGTCPLRTCQRQTGSAFLAEVAFPWTALQFTKGRPKPYKSSAILERNFCANCGSPLINRYLVPVGDSLSDNPDTVWVLLGTLDDPSIVTPKFHFAVETQFSWVKFEDGPPRIRCDEDHVLAETLAAASKTEN